MADDEKERHPLRRLEIAFVPGAGGDKAVWNLRSDDTRRYRLVEQTAWRWLLCDPNGDSYPSPRQLELAGEIIPDGVWPSDAALDAQTQKMRADGGGWLADLLPWTPYLIVGSCRAEKERKRAALLALLFAGLIAEDDPELRITLFHLRRLAWENLAALYENPEKKHPPEMEAALRRALYAWQDEIARQERRGFFALTLAEQEDQAEGKRFLRVHEVEDRAEIQSRREEAMKDVLLTGPDGQRRLRALFRDSEWGEEMARALIRRWFLPRYDLDVAERLKRSLGVGRWSAPQTRDDAESDNAGRIGGWSWPALLAKWSLIGVLLLMVIFFGLAFRCKAGCDATVDPISWLVVGCGLLQLPHWFIGGAPDTSLPRLRAGIFLGVVATVLQQNWDNLLEFSYEHPLALCLVAIGLFVAAFQVLEAKVAGATTPDERATKGVKEQLLALLPWLWPQARRRSGSILWRGLALSFGLSLLLVDLLGDSYVETSRQAQEGAWLARSLPGISGGTYPSLVLLFTAILLFAGIFGQLLWEEKSLTEALA